MANITKIEELEGGEKCTIRGKVTYKSDKLTTKKSNRFEFSLYDGHYLRCVCFSYKVRNKYEELFKLIQAGEYYTIQNAEIEVNSEYHYLEINLKSNSKITVCNDELNIPPHADIIGISDVVDLKFHLEKPSSKIISTAGFITCIHEPEKRTLRNGEEEQLRKIEITHGNENLFVTIWNNNPGYNIDFEVGNVVVVENCLLTEYDNELDVNVGQRHSKLTINPDWIKLTVVIDEEPEIMALGNELKILTF
ncbi:hypothetical protein V9T40_003609 [Parthenolecanium corni]|uniref:Replication protein A OB domain-containing protein n=1 Tax=Parthenolecanium corni TaxID=536013 RepID=A0AAN9TVN6_9HEMI